MSLAVVWSRAHRGLDAPPVAVEVHLSNGLPGLSMVGMAETAVKESKDRVRSAILTSNFEFPARRITVNLAPADLPKAGGQFDLPIALGILAASSQLPDVSFDNIEFLGELALNGDLRPVRGCLPAAIACGKRDNVLCCPTANAGEALLSGATRILDAPSLLAVCEHLVGTRKRPLRCGEGLDKADHDNDCGPDLADVRGQAQARRALEIAAAGNHHLLLYGPPGTGKSMLAERLPGLLPPMSQQEAVEVACVQSLTRRQLNAAWPRRPFSTPHHTASAVALVGGGSNPAPGEISLAHNGVLFLDELPEFQRSVLEVLREPLETGQICISRASGQVTFPSRFQLVAAMNPCPCGYFGDRSNSLSRSCTCSAEQVRRYRARLSGPLLDRIDMHVPVLPLKQGELYADAAGEDSASVRQRVIAARQRQHTRQACSNGQLAGLELNQLSPLTPAQQLLMERAMLRLGFSTRALQRIHKLARTIADLAASETIADAHLLEAFSYRNLDRAQGADLTTLASPPQRAL